jgi:hypothetical protein
MVIIRGRVDPGRSPDAEGRWRHLMGLGRWNLEYTVKDKAGRLVEQGTFKADLTGCFVLRVDVADPGTVEIRVRGRAAEAEDSCSVRIVSANDVVNLPRRLYPYNGRGNFRSKAA